MEQREFNDRVVKYAADGLHHYYFMSLDNNLVVDATDKGSLTRFLNHSCDPNAETQKVINTISYTDI